MKLLILILISILILLFESIMFSQTIATDSLYLGQTPTGNTPQIFKLNVDSGFFNAERITISNDGLNIYYSQIKGYYPIRGTSIRRYSYFENKWNGPFTLFEGYCSPALSANGDTMYFQNDSVETFCSIKNGLEWSKPQRILSNLKPAHYFQVTNNGNYYISSKPKIGNGASDWCNLLINDTDTIAISLDRPLNTSGDNLDFFVSKDETYMIVCSPYFGLAVSYHKTDGSWTNPRNLGSKINFGLGMWGVYVSPDNKYLFYTTGTKEDYSDVYVYWVRIDGLIDSLKHTNISPYVKKLIKNETLCVGQEYIFTVPENAFFDEDGDNKLAYSATLIDGSPLPLWLNFNKSTATFSGTPIETGKLILKLIATDSENGTAFCPFTLDITSKTNK